MSSTLDELPLLPDLAGGSSYKTLAERAFLTLRSAILKGQLEPGTRLMIQPLAARLDMSPMPVRDALQKLVEFGLAQQEPHRGAHVTELTIDDLRDVYEVRIALESLAVARAAAHFTAADAAVATSRIEQFTAACSSGDDERSWAEHWSFHMALYESSGSRRALRLIPPMWESSERYRVRWPPPVRPAAERRADHELILEACIAHDATTAADLMRFHLSRVANRIAHEMGSGDLFSADGTAA
jgi:DNA-binding GntR family transcriptional regulator